MIDRFAMHRMGQGQKARFNRVFYITICKGSQCMGLGKRAETIHEELLLSLISLLFYHLSIYLLNDTY